MVDSVGEVCYRWQRCITTIHIAVVVCPFVSGFLAILNPQYLLVLLLLPHLGH